MSSRTRGFWPLCGEGMSQPRVQVDNGRAGQAAKKKRERRFPHPTKAAKSAPWGLGPCNPHGVLR